MLPVPLTLYTLGHSDLTVEAFRALLTRYQVRVLLDVRSAPYSKFVPHFNKAALEADLIAHDFAYRYAGEFLGGRPSDPTVYADEAIPNPDLAREKYLKVVQYDLIMQRDWYQRGIARLITIMREEAARGTFAAIMCSEGDPRECHRHHLIARSLIDPSVRVTDVPIQIVHLRKDGDAETLDPAEFTAIPRQVRLL
jgi:uncharacterized protein (DUF488 family)